MKKFERFIIYPMLFIALFFSFADDGVQQTTAQDFFNEIITKKISIMNNDTKEVMVLEGTDGGGRITLNSGKNEENIVITSDAEDGSSLIALKKPNQDIGMILSAVDNETGIRLYGPLNSYYEKDKTNMPSLSIISSNENNGINIQGKAENSGLFVGNNDDNGGVGLMNIKDYGGGIVVYDSYGDKMVEISKNGNKDGAIFIYDKYNEKYGAYSYGGYGGDFKNK